MLAKVSYLVEEGAMPRSELFVSTWVVAFDSCSRPTWFVGTIWLFQKPFGDRWCVEDVGRDVRWELVVEEHEGE
jgi:hypothetical protein